MSQLLEQDEAAGWFGQDVSDIPVAVQAEALVWWDSCTGWLPGEGNREELEDYCGTVFNRLMSMQSVDVYLPEPKIVDGEIEVYDLDILLAVGAGISRALKEAVAEDSL